MLKLGTVFSGIGAIEHALKRMNIPYEIVLASDNGGVDIFGKKIKKNYLSLQESVIDLNLYFENVDLTEFNDFNNVPLQDQIQFINTEFDCLNILVDSISENLLQKDIFRKVIKESVTLARTIDKPAKLKDINFLLENEEIKIENTLFNEIKKFYIKESTLDKSETEYLNKEFKLFQKEEPNIASYKNIMNDIIDAINTVYERYKTATVYRALDALKTPKEKKDYIDELYKSKKKSNYVWQTYLANYDVDENHLHWNVSFIDGKPYRDQIDLFVGGSPCQSFSMVGKRRGLEDTRGTLFYEYARLINEIQPKVFIYENVRGLLSHDEGNTWKTMKQIFSDLNYDFHTKVLNSKDFGVPQNRERIFVVGFRKDLKLEKEFNFPTPIPLEKKMQDYLVENVPGSYYLNKKGVDFVIDEKNLNKSYTQINGDIQLCQKANQQFNWHGDFIFVPENKTKTSIMKDLEKYFLSQKVKEYVLASGTGNFYSRPEIDLEIARPLLTTMHKMHRSGVDNYVTTEGRIRKLTPRECLRLMGFSDDFEILVSDTQMYKQAGNSIVVDVLIHIVREICTTLPALAHGENYQFKKPIIEQISFDKQLTN